MKRSSSRTRPTTLAGALQGHQFLAGMEPDHIGKIVASAMLKSFAPGETIFKEGEPANRFYLICRGKIALETTQDNGAKVPVQNLGANEVLGWSWLFPPYYWHFSARTTAPTQTVFCYGTRLRQQCEDDPRFGYEIMKRVAEILISRLQNTRLKMLQIPRREFHSTQRDTEFYI